MFGFVNYDCFYYTYSLQSSSTPSPISSSFDALYLDMFIMSRSKYAPYNLSRIAQESSTQLVIPANYFNRDGAAIIISNSNDLQRIVIGNNCFQNAISFSLTSLID